MSDEQRRYMRTPLQVAFRGRDLLGAGQLLFEGRDLSPGGAFLHSEVLLEDGEELGLEFRVPGVPRILRARGRVVWVRRFPLPGEAPGMGVAFSQMSDEDRAVLGDYLIQLHQSEP